MQVVKEYHDSRHTMLFVGPPGSGKTTLACHLFGKENTISIAYDPKQLKAVGKIDALLMDPHRPWEDTIEALAVLKRDFKHKKCITVSDMTHMSRQLLYAEPKGKDVRRAYAMAIDKLRQFIEKLLTEFDQHIIMEAVDMFIRDEEDKVMYTLPNVIGKDTFATELPGMVDHVFYVNLPKNVTEIVNGKPTTKVIRTILTQANGTALAKNRMNIAGEPRILDISEVVMIEDGSFANIEALRMKLLGTTAL